MRNAVYERLCTDSMYPLKSQINVQSIQLPQIKGFCDASNWSNKKAQNFSTSQNTALISSQLLLQPQDIRKEQKFWDYIVAERCDGSSN